jgi:hypothetical protein
MRRRNNKWDSGTASYSNGADYNTVACLLEDFVGHDEQPFSFFRAFGLSAEAIELWHKDKDIGMTFVGLDMQLN